jgi:hypothetical protein
MTPEYNKGVVDALTRFKVAGNFFGPMRAMGSSIWQDLKGAGSALKGGFSGAMSEGGGLKNITNAFASGSPGRQAVSNLMGPAALVGGGMLLHKLMAPKQDPYRQPY